MQEVVYHTNYEIEDTYFWFLARAEIVLSVVNKFKKLNQNVKSIDIGCGTGGFASNLSKQSDVTCLDISETALNYCQKRGLNKLILGDLSQVNVKNKFDIAFMLDVVEHIEDDKKVVNEVKHILNDDGIFVSAVPAYQWLWSHHDVVHMHFRRYNINQYKKLIEDSGFTIKYISYYNSFLFLPVIIKRFIDKIFNIKKDDPVEKVPNLLNKLFFRIFRSEKFLIPNIKFPFGLSIICIAQKK